MMVQQNEVKAYALIDFSGKKVMLFTKREYAIEYMKDSNQMLYESNKDLIIRPSFFYLLKEK